MDNFQNNNNLNNNENGQEQNNTQSSFSYDYAKNDTINTSGTVVEENFGKIPVHQSVSAKLNFWLCR